MRTRALCGGAQTTAPAQRMLPAMDELPPPEPIDSTGAPPVGMFAAPFFHPESQEVRFCVAVGATSVGASIGKATLHYRFCPDARNDDPLQTFTAHAGEIEAAVRRRVGAGSLQPVMLREHDLPRA